MQRTGGILAIIAGVFGLLAAIVTVGMSNPGGALEPRADFAAPRTAGKATKRRQKD